MATFIILRKWLRHFISMVINYLVEMNLDLVCCKTRILLVQFLRGYLLAFLRTKIEQIWCTNRIKSWKLLSDSSLICDLNWKKIMFFNICLLTPNQPNCKRSTFYSQFKLTVSRLQIRTKTFEHFDKLEKITRTLLLVIIYNENEYTC